MTCSWRDSVNLTAVSSSSSLPRLRAPHNPKANEQPSAAGSDAPRSLLARNADGSIRLVDQEVAGRRPGFMTPNRADD